MWRAHRLNLKLLLGNEPSRHTYRGSGGKESGIWNRSSCQPGEYAWNVCKYQNHKLSNNESDSRHPEGGTDVVGPSVALLLDGDIDVFVEFCISMTESP